MRALQFTAYGGPEILRWDDAPVPHAGPGQVRIAVRAASVNPVDWKLMTGVMSGGQPLAGPGYLGRDGAGVVDEVGEGVTGVFVGDEVFGRRRLAAPGDRTEPDDRRRPVPPPAVPVAQLPGRCRVLLSAVTILLLALSFPGTYAMIGRAPASPETRLEGRRKPLSRAVKPLRSARNCRQHGTAASSAARPVASSLADAEPPGPPVRNKYVRSVRTSAMSPGREGPTWLGNTSRPR